MNDAFLSDVFEQVGQFVDVGTLLTAQNDSVRLEEVSHGCAFSQKLRIACDCVSLFVGFD